MPKNTRKRRRTSKPNVFVQSDIPSGDGGNVRATTSASSDTDSAPQQRARVQRTTQRASARSEIYTRSLSAELRKMGALSGIIVVVLAVLTFTL